MFRVKALEFRVWGSGFKVARVGFQIVSGVWRLRLVHCGVPGMWG